jgi:cell wall-associated NlpC family hydrolase
MIPAERLIEEARKLIGAKWRHCGRKPWAVDCIGLIVVAAKNAGLDLSSAIGVKEPKTYSREGNEMTVPWLESRFERIQLPVPGCLVVITFMGERLPRHFALYTEKETIIHANGLHNKVLEHGYRYPWTKMTNSLWKIPGIQYVN